MANLDREMIVSNHVDFDDLYDRAYLESTLQCCYFFLLLYVCGFFFATSACVSEPTNRVCCDCILKSIALNENFFFCFPRGVSIRNRVAIHCSEEIEL